MDIPYLIEFGTIGDQEIGYISVFENTDRFPFPVERVFWTYSTPGDVIRGRHALRATKQILFALTGRITVTTESTDGEKHVFTLDRPNVGLYLPPDWWRTMQYSAGAVQLVLASTRFEESDYIRSYESFTKTP